MTKKKVVKETPKVVKKTTFKEFKIVDANNVLLRTYDTKTHGKDAGKLAEGFIKKFPNFRIEEVEEPRTDEANFTSVPGEKQV